jgi:SAM-dependent methyltransferase
VDSFESDVASWEELARTDPLWAVLSSDEFRDAALTPDAEERFWRSGEQHVDHVLAIVRHEIAPGFAPAVSVDFGCGVGRNLVPLASRSGYAIGLDASPTMLERARDRLDASEIDNAAVGLVGRRIDWSAVAVPGPVDFVHSVLVFQHIVPEEGFALFDQLLEILAPGGCGFVQFHARSPGGPFEGMVRSLRFHHLRLNALALKSGIPALRDVVMLYQYDVLDLLRHLTAHRIADVVVERTDTGRGGYDVRLYFAKFDGTEEEYQLKGRPMQLRTRP